VLIVPASGGCLAGRTRSTGRPDRRTRWLASRPLVRFGSDRGCPPNPDRYRPDIRRVGESDLAWVASDRGLSAAERSGDAVVIGSLLRSVSHSLLSTGQYAAAVRMTEQAGGYLRAELARPDDSLRVTESRVLGGRA